MRAWSFSSLNTYFTCPRQYYLTYVTKVIPYTETDATRWGTEVHLALEEYARDGKPLADKYAPFKPYADKILSLPGDKFFEQKFALTEALKPCDFEAPEAWVRGIVDVGVLAPPRALVNDWKTGKVRPDSDQLKLFAGFIFQSYPHVETAKTVYTWLAHKQTTCETYHRDQSPIIWQHFMAKANKLKASYDKDKWLPNPSGLCKGWCGAGRANCEFWCPKKK